MPDPLRRPLRTLGQARYGWFHPRRVTFVFGCQRSGTKMVLRILENNPRVRIFHENDASAFRDFELRGDPVIRALIAANPAPVQVFKPICDSHRADELLARFPEARGLWVHRTADDVARSAVAKWGDHQREVIGAVARGELDRWGWRTARLRPAVIEDVRRVWREDLTPIEGALLFWYMRNAFFFDLGVDRHARMHLAKYEDLLAGGFPAVFAHVGADFDPSYVERVRPGSHERVPARPEIRTLCDALAARLDAWAPPVAVPSHVVMLINTLGVGGAERYVVTAANWLAERGARVEIAASDGGELVAELRPEVRFHPTPLRRVRATLPNAALAVRRLLRDRPSVVLTHSLAVTWVARLADPLHRTPIVNVAHGWPAHRYRLVAPLMRVADRVVAVSPEVRDRLGFPCDVVFNGVDTAGMGPRTGEVRASARAAMGAGPDELLVVTVGRLTAQKAQHHVIALAVRMPGTRFAIVGEGERMEELSHPGVRMLGLRRDVPDLLGSADVYLSCSDWEGMSLTIIEAMAAGLPVVATRTEGSVHLVGPECGILVPVGDVAAMAGAIEQLSDPAVRMRMGAAGRARAIAHFGHERMMKELVAAIGRV